MSYDQFETSNFGGLPIALYEFQIGTREWKYANSDSPVFLNNVEYLPLPITDEGITIGGTTQMEEITINLPASVELVQIFADYPPSLPCYVVVRRKHTGSQESPVLWVGTINAVKQSTDAAASILASPLTASFNRAGLRLSWGRQCPYALYDVDCKVNPNTYSITATVESLTSRQVTSTGFTARPAGWLAGGYIEWELLVGVTERRGIEVHNDATLTILGLTFGLQVGQIVTAYAGCMRDTNTCLTKFNNLANYGGFPMLPGKSPFDGERVF